MPDDKRLAKRLRDGNTAAFRNCYHKYVQKLYAFALRTARCPALAEDVVHDVFVKMWENRHKIDPEQSLQAWLFTVTRNHLLNLIKRKKIELAAVEQIYSETEPGQNHTEDEVLYNESERLFRQAVDQLPEKRRQIFRLCHIQGLTYDEAASQLNISSSTVNSQMVKARSSIKNYLSHKNSSPPSE